MTEQADLITLGLGERLRLAREERGIELQAVAAATRLSENTLRIIEDEKWQRLPPVYRAGYARNYAAYLGVSLEDYEDEIKRLCGQEQSVLQSVFSEGIKINKMDTNLRVLTYAVMSIFVVLPLIWAYTKTAANLSQPDTVVVTRPAQTRGLERSSVDIPGQTRGETRPAIPAHMEANVVPLQSLGSKNVASAGRDVADDSSRDAAVSGTAVQGDYAALDILIKADSWVVITDASGLRLEYDLLRGGNSYSYSGTAPFDILIGRASAIESRCVSVRDAACVPDSASWRASFSIAISMALFGGPATTRLLQTLRIVTRTGPVRSGAP